MKRLVFPDTDEGAQLYNNVFSAYFSSPYRPSKDEELHRAVKIVEARAKITEPAEDGARKLRRGEGAQVILLEDAEYEFLKARIMEFGWPLLLVEQGKAAREFVASAEDMKPE